MFSHMEILFTEEKCVKFAYSEPKFYQCHVQGLNKTGETPTKWYFTKHNLVGLLFP